MMDRGIKERDGEDETSTSQERELDHSALHFCSFDGRSVRVHGY